MKLKILFAFVAGTLPLACNIPVENIDNCIIIKEGELADTLIRKCNEQNVEIIHNGPMRIINSPTTGRTVFIINHQGKREGLDINIISPDENKGEEILLFPNF